jgi:hypothetical protein
LEERAWREGLQQVSFVRCQSDTAGQVRRVAAHDDNTQRRPTMAQLDRQRDAVHASAAKVHIRYQYRRWGLTGVYRHDLKRGFSAGGSSDLQAGSFKAFGEDLPEEHFVFDHKHIHAQPSVLRSTPPLPAAIRRPKMTKR